MRPLIVSATYFEKDRDLLVRFSVGAYIYSGVPADVAAGFVELISRRVNGGYPEDLDYFNSKIEGKYKSRREDVNRQVG